MSNFKILFFLLFLVPFSSGAVNVLGGEIVVGDASRIIQGVNIIRPNFNFTTLNVTGANLWLTPIGTLNTPNATQFNNNGGTLTIDELWLATLNLWGGFYCELTGCTMEGDINMDDNDILNVRNITANNFIGNTSFWLNDSGTINTTTNANYFFQRNVSVFDLEVRNPGSIKILVGDDTATLSAASFAIGNKTRTFLNLNNDFVIRKDSNQTIGMGILNLDDKEASGTSFLMSVDNNTAYSMQKHSINFSTPYQALLANERGSLDIINTEKSIRIGFFDDIEVLPDLSFGKVINERITMEINESFVSVNGSMNVNENITVDNYGFFGFIGSITNRVTKIWASTLDVEGNINQTNGNATINMIYGSMWSQNSAGYMIDLVTLNVYENITNQTPSFNNGFTLNGNTSLIATTSGIYSVSYSISFADTASSEVGILVGVNGIEQNQTYCKKTINTGGTIVNCAGSNTINISSGDSVTLMARDENNPVQDISVVGSNLIVERIGEQ